MYELWIDVNGNFLYYTTDRDNIEDAWDEMTNKMYSIGIVTDNFGYTEIELRKWLDDGSYEVGSYEVVERRAFV